MTQRLRILCLTFILPTVSLQSVQAAAGERVTLSQVLARLHENGLKHEKIMLSADASIVVLRRGGRILGPFVGRQQTSVFWLNPAFADTEAFRSFLASGSTRIGGERVWIAPEIQYHVEDRKDFWGSIALPKQVDPGDYTLLRTEENVCHLSLDVTLEAHNLATGEKRLRLERAIRPAHNPLRQLAVAQTLMKDVVFAGYEHTLELSEKISNEIMTESWQLIQFYPGGAMILPASPLLEYTDYFDPLPANWLSRHAGHVRVKTTGNRQFKIGVKAAHLIGRPAYYAELPDESAYLVINNFHNNPSTVYAEEPPQIVGNRGHSVHIYNDDGRFGGFCELECNGQTIGGQTGKSSSRDAMVIWVFVGPRQRIETIGLHLLGVDLSQASP